MAKVRLNGILKGTLPVTMRQKQSMLPLVRDLTELQHWAVGEVPLALLFERKPTQGLKEELIIDALHGVTIWAYAGAAITIAIANTRASLHRDTKRSMCIYSKVLAPLGIWIIKRTCAQKAQKKNGFGSLIIGKEQDKGIYI